MQSDSGQERLPIGTKVRHLGEKYIGFIDGVTKLKNLFTGDTHCEWQYRLKIPGQDIRRIAPANDLEVVIDKAKSLPTLSGPCLYHFTDHRNIASIKKYGLVSWQRLIEREIFHHPASNDLSRDLDLNRNLQGYVRLCLVPAHRMAYVAERDGRVEQLVWLKIDPAVLYWSETMFSDRNATDNYAIINKDRNTALKSTCLEPEVLIKDALAPKWIYFD